MNEIFWYKPAGQSEWHLYRAIDGNSYCLLRVLMAGMPKDARSMPGRDACARCAEARDEELKMTATKKKKSSKVTRKKSGKRVLNRSPTKWAATQFAQEMLEWLELGACEVTVAMDNGQVITIRNPGIILVSGDSEKITLPEAGS